jgi:PKD repeat protein
MRMTSSTTAAGAARWCALAALLTVMPAGIACDKVPLTAPSDSTITLYADTTSLALNGTATITAMVIESAGTAVQNGTVVTFLTTLGTLDPAEARTQNGKATVTLHAGTKSGTASISATSGGNTTESALSIAVGASAASTVTLAASPSSLPANGGAVQLTAAVYDAGGNRLPGVTVTFTSDAGSVSPTSAATNSNGEATSTLTTTQDATVTATVVGADSTTLTAEAAIVVRAAPTVSITVGTTSPVEDSAVSFTFTVTPSANAAVRSATVSFGDGSAQSLNTNGTTSVSHVYTSSGTYTVIATATDAAGETTTATASVVIADAAPLNVTLSASGLTKNAVTTLTASVTSTTTPSIEGYTWSFGDGATRTTSGSPTTHIYTAAGTYTVTVRVVTVDGRSGSAEIEIIVS